METTEMNTEGRAALAELEQEIDEKATKWINEVVPEIYKVLERAGITYSEDLVCESLNDGFRAGYMTCLADSAQESKKEK